MDSKLLLIKSITLLYCERRLSSVKVNSKFLIEAVVDTLKIPVQVGEVDLSRNAIIGLSDTLDWMLQDNDSEPFDLPSLLQRIKVNVGNDESVLEPIVEIVKYSALEEDELKQSIRKLVNELNVYLNQYKIKELIQKAHREVVYNNRKIDWDSFTNNLVSDLEQHTKGMNKSQKSFMLNLVSMNDPKAIKDVLQRAKEDTEGSGGFKSGWQAVNRMLGESEHFRRGMFVLVGALTHNYKSGFCHDLFRHFCTLNTPVLDDPKKKPLLIYISGENRAEEDLIRMYVALKENETGVAVNVNTIDLDEASEYIATRLKERNFDVEILRIDAGAFTTNELFNLVLDYESDGYEVQCIIFDYLSLISKKNLGSNSMGGEDVRLLMQTVRVFMSARNILFITPHQLSQEAMLKKREGTVNFLAEIAGKNYWDASKRIANEVDLEIFVDIVARNKDFYLHVHRGKHRTVKATPVIHREFYLPFSNIGYIPEDIDGEDRSVKSLIGVGVGDVDFED